MSTSSDPRMAAEQPSNPTPDSPGQGARISGAHLNGSGPTSSSATGRTAGEALDAARRHLLSLQLADGHWCGELEGDTILESEYILARYFAGQGDDPRVELAANYMRQTQLPTGGWAQYPGGPADVSASVKAYFTLKLCGDSPDTEHMVRARTAILEKGGIAACNSFTQIYLAIFGQYDWARCPTVPPELILLPNWFYLNLYEMSSWSRAIVVPLSIVSALKPRCEVPDWANIDELLHPTFRSPNDSIWTSLFLKVGNTLDKLPHVLTRKRALQRAEEWILERMEDSDGVGAIFPSMVNCLFALKALGYPMDYPHIQRQLAELDKLEVIDGDVMRVQPCLSPVWDTALSVNALVESGTPPDDPDLLRAAEWLLDRRGHGRGDWRVKNSQAEVPGWFFEYANPFYPDCDTTAETIIALSKLRFPEGRAAEFQKAIGEAHHWHLTMQNKDGGWAAFDKGCDKAILTRMPFADHNAMLDPSTADLTSRAIEKLVALGFDRNAPPARQAIEFLLKEQEADGSWFGRWGCNYVYGTWLAAFGLVSIGVDPHQPWGQRAAAWLRSVQNPDGGWGELPMSYDDPSTKGQGPSTSSQTAWAIMGLMALVGVDDPAVQKGVDYLIRTQREDGSWYDEHWTGTGFPKVFYLRYHMYCAYFPLQAIGYYVRGGISDHLTNTTATAETTA